MGRGEFGEHGERGERTEYGGDFKDTAERRDEH
jgi:hypothetical protein